MSTRQLVKNFLKDNIESAYHASCTLPMGSVTSNLGLMENISGLRVVDASIMPDMVSGNLNATVIMMAEKIAYEMENPPLQD